MRDMGTLLLIGVLLCSLITDRNSGVLEADSKDVTHAHSDAESEYAGPVAETGLYDAESEPEAFEQEAPAALSVESFVYRIYADQGAGTRRYQCSAVSLGNGQFATVAHLVQRLGNRYRVLIEHDGKEYAGRFQSIRGADLALVTVEGLDVPGLEIAEPSYFDSVTAYGLTTLTLMRGLVTESQARTDGLTEFILQLLPEEIGTRPGDSGGAVVNDDGQLIGVLTEHLSSDARKAYFAAVSRLKTLVKETEAPESSEAVSGRTLESLIPSEGGAVVIFSTTWCGPCQAYKLSTGYEQIPGVIAMDAEQESALWSEAVSRFNSNTVPMTIYRDSSGTLRHVSDVQTKAWLNARISGEQLHAAVTSYYRSAPQRSWRWRR
ncbi:Trypsin [Thalassoglobus neptunius]|uniref:Trypsin n=1 Tax=Thalassoglobus neptunius TaxID=1938619 RepID=A0A5C5X947_9PLAN|nr:trypsin-like peptidase domain-containing protein [Thalassoglobus neptunius]TWT58901.1 Trypsin [Thalassoglobus neptunius]